MARFYVEPGQISGGRVIITGPDVKHISKVLRLGPGDEITVLDGAGWAYVARLGRLGPQAVEATVLERRPWQTDPPVRVTLVQGIAKGEKMELIIQKCTELGIHSIIPVFTARTVVALADDKKNKRRERWQRVAEEASKQAGRTSVPRVEEPCSWAEVWAKTGEDALKIIPYEGEKAQGLKKVLAALSLPESASGERPEVYVFIGPEGGFEPAEVALAVEHSARPVTLGPRILRTETAGFAVLAAIMYELGDLGG